MNDDIALVGIPKDTFDLIQAIAKKTSKSMVDVLAEAILEKARKHLAPPPEKSVPKPTRPRR